MESGLWRDRSAYRFWRLRASSQQAWLTLSDWLTGFCPPTLTPPRLLDILPLVRHSFPILLSQSIRRPHLLVHHLCFMLDLDLHSISLTLDTPKSALRTPNPACSYNFLAIQPPKWYIPSCAPLLFLPLRRSFSFHRVSSTRRRSFASLSNVLETSVAPFSFA